MLTEEAGKNFYLVLGYSHIIIWNGAIVGRLSSVLPYCKFFSCYSSASLGVIQQSKCYLTQAVRKPKSRHCDLFSQRNYASVFSKKFRRNMVQANWKMASLLSLLVILVLLQCYSVCLHWYFWHQAMKRIWSLLTNCISLRPGGLHFSLAGDPECLGF